MTLRRWKFCIIGGLAVQQWGEPRATLDVDLTLLIGLGEGEKFIEPHWFIKAVRQQGLLPAVVREAPAAYSVKTSVPELQLWGNAAIPVGPKLALFCSVKCPGKLILDTYDLCQCLREKGVIVISGFHSPMERECLRILLRSTNPVIWCLARGLLTQIPKDLRKSVDEGRLLIVSSFPAKVRRVTAKTAMSRKWVVADLADSVVVVHAASGSKIEALCRELLAVGKPVYTFDHPANAALLQAGAKFVNSETDLKQLVE